jgi:RNA methyltransferase, TrmH family
MNEEVITSKDNAKVKRAYSFKDGKGDHFLVEGFHLCEMALSFKAADEIFSCKPYECSLPHYLVNEDIIKKLATSKNPEGIVAICHKNKAQTLTNDRVLFLDEVSDPGNIGTLLRGALAFGFKDVVIAKGATPYSSRALLASQGAIFGLNVVESKEPLPLLDSLHANGYFLLGTDLTSSVPLKSMNIEDDAKLVLVLGNEARGVSKDVLKKMDACVRIEMGGIDSLNVAMAGSILMYKYQKTGIKK